MRLIRSFLALLTAISLITGPAMATVVVAGPGTAYAPNIFFVGANDLTSAYTNATTSATDLTGTSIVVSATKKRYDLQYFQVCWTADATKSTSTTGSVGVYVNGALAAGSTRFIASAAGRGTIGGCYVVARSSAAAQTIALQGVSADTASFAVTTASIQVWVIQLGG
jgi:hypothetical protein